MTDLPTDREKALEAIAAGWGRTATAAHPLCVCGKPYTVTCYFCHAKPNQPCRKTWDDDELEPDGRHRGRARRVGQSKDCPMHRPTPGSSRQG